MDEVLWLGPQVMIISSSYHSVYLRCLARQVTTIDALLVKMMLLHENNENYVSPIAFRTNIELAFKNFPRFWKAWKDVGTWEMLNDVVSVMYAWPEMESWTVERRFCITDLFL